MNRAMLAAVEILADDTPRRTGPDFGKASPLGLLVVVLLLIGTVFLIRSMNRHLRQLPASFDRDDPEPDQAVDDGTVGVENPADGDGPGREPER